MGTFVKLIKCFAKNLVFNNLMQVSYKFYNKIRILRLLLLINQLTNFAYKYVIIPLNTALTGSLPERERERERGVQDYLLQL